MMKHFRGVDLDPNGDGTDDSLAAFMTFILRDAATFMGLLPDKKKIEGREVQLALHKQKYYAEKLEYLRKIAQDL